MVARGIPGAIYRVPLMQGDLVFYCLKGFVNSRLSFSALLFFYDSKTRIRFLEVFNSHHSFSAGYCSEPIFLQFKDVVVDSSYTQRLFLPQCNFVL